MSMRYLTGCFRESVMKLVVCVMGKRKVIDGDLNDASELYCYEKEIENNWVFAFRRRLRRLNEHILELFRRLSLVTQTSNENSALIFI